MHVDKKQFCTDWTPKVWGQLTGWQKISQGVETYMWWKILRKQQKLFLLGSFCPRSTSGMKKKQLASSLGVTRFYKAELCTRGECIQVLLLPLHTWGLFPDSQLRIELVNSVERAYELRRRECREPNTWPVIPLGNAFEIHLTPRVLNKPGNDI